MSETELSPDLLDEAAHWIAVLSAGGAAERQSFLAWLRADPSHVEAMRRAEAAWSGAAQLPALAEFQAVRRRDAAILARRRERVVGRRWMPSLATAATLVAVVAAGLVLWRLESVQPVAYQTGPGERRAVELADGSVVRLDSATRLTATIGWRTRQVQLDQGGAEFVVAHERVRAFTVSTDRVAVRAIGTDFVVRKEAGETSVMLVSGVVDLREPNSGRLEARMVPGQKASYDETGKPPVMRTVRTADELAWQSGQIVLDRVRLAEALRRFARYDASPVRIPPELASLEVSGVYRTDELVTFLDELSRVQNLGWRRGEDGMIQLSRRAVDAKPGR